jgi:hypothetical protein
MAVCPHYLAAPWAGQLSLISPLIVEPNEEVGLDVVPTSNTFGTSGMVS